MATLADEARRLNRSSPWQAPAFALLTDMRRLPDPRPLLPLLPPGALLILRHTDPRERARMAAILAPLCRARRLTLVVSDDFALAVRHRAGLHLPERALAGSPRIRRWQRAGGLLTAATHSRRALVRAAGVGAAVALLSPVYPTASHPSAPALGTFRFRNLARLARLPVMAMGGVTARLARPLHGARVAGVATVGGLKAS